MQYKVPQNVDIEDKVIAGLTLRQFTFLMIAGGSVLAAYYMLPAALKGLFMPLGLLIGGAGVALAFVKVNDRPLEIFIVSALKTLLSPSKRVWQKEIITEEQEQETSPLPNPKPKKKSIDEIHTNLERLAMIVDSGSHGLVEERISNVRNNTDTTNNVGDILQSAEKGSERMNKLIDIAKTLAKSKNSEPTISQMSTTQVTKEQFKYAELGLKDERELENIVNKATQKQKEKDDALEKATIIKH